MRILLYSANFAPEPTGVGKYSGDMAAWLSLHGHDVRVIAAPPYYPAYRLDPGYRWRPFCRERVAGATVWRAPLWVPRKPRGISRILHLASFAATSLPLALANAAWRPDVVLTVAPFLTCAPAAWLTARLCGAMAWLHIQDFEVDAAFDLGLLKGRGLRRLAVSMERQLMRRFDVVSTISRRMLERLHAKGVDPEQTCLLPNWVDTHEIKPLAGPSPMRAELGIGAGTRVALFAGTLGPKQGLAMIAEAAERLRTHPDLLFVVCGQGVMWPQMEEAARRLPNLRLLPLQPVERLCDLLNMADIHLLTQDPGAQDLVLPSKLTGMLASGRPIIATCREGTEISSIVRPCGLVVAPGDVDGLAGAIEALASNTPLRTSLGAKAREYAEQRLGRDAILMNFLWEVEQRELSRSDPDMPDQGAPAVAVVPIAPPPTLQEYAHLPD